MMADRYENVVLKHRQLGESLTDAALVDRLNDLGDMGYKLVAVVVNDGKRFHYLTRRMDKA